MNSNNNFDCIAIASGGLVPFPPALEVGAGGVPKSQSIEETEQSKEQLRTVTAPASVRMVRYRLGVGYQHQVAAEELKKILIEESGVDKRNINIINIQNDYTLVELPDEMPQDIFQHLKSVEINEHKLEIKRVKARSKKRSNYRKRRGKPRSFAS